MKDKEILYWCNRCQENSVRRKAYTRTDGVHRRLDFCINRSCGYREILADTPKETFSVKGIFRRLYERTIGEWRIRLMLKKFYKRMEAK